MGSLCSRWHVAYARQAYLDGLYLQYVCVDKVSAEEHECVFGDGKKGTILVQVVVG